MAKKVFFIWRKMWYLYYHKISIEVILIPNSFFHLELTLNGQHFGIKAEWQTNGMLKILIEKSLVVGMGPKFRTAKKLTVKKCMCPVWYLQFLKWKVQKTKKMYFVHFISSFWTVKWKIKLSKRKEKLFLWFGLNKCFSIILLMQTIKSFELKNKQIRNCLCATGHISSKFYLLSIHLCPGPSLNVRAAPTKKVCD